MSLVRHFLSGWLIFSLFPLQGTAKEPDKTAQTFPRDSAQPPVSPTPCSTGISTWLKRGGFSRSAHHNGNQGEAHFILENKDSGSVLWEERLPGEGICFGYNLLKRAHLIGIRKEQGIGARITGIYYIDEVKPKRRNSAFNRAKIEAFVAVPGPDLHYVALLGIEDNDTYLYVLDVEKSSITKLGEAPLPPPLTAKERDLIKDYPDALAAKWEWMSPCRDSYMELDPGVIVFKGAALLQVSYGNDTAERRAQQRDLVTFDLQRGQRLTK